MEKISQGKQIKEYCKVVGQLCENSLMRLKKIAHNAEMSRNTVSKYLKIMYADDILVGPWMSLNPHPDYKEYVYLMNFSDPPLVFEGLKGFPHVLYYEMTFGDWNTMVITDRQLDFSQLKGFESIVHQGIKGHVYTPKVEFTTWDESLKKVYEQIKEFIPGTPEPQNELAPPLDWGEDEWKLYHAFKSNLRKKVTPLLKKIKVRYETYTEWTKTLHNHCTIHTEFYPQGCNTYTSYCLLLSSDYKQSIISLFFLFPTTPVIMEVGNRLLVFVKVITPDVIRDMMCTIYDMETVEMIKEFSQAVVVSKSSQVMP